MEANICQTSLGRRGHMGVGLVTSCFCINLLTGGVGVVPLGKDSYQAGGCLLTRERVESGILQARTATRLEAVSVGRPLSRACATNVVIKYVSQGVLSRLTRSESNCPGLKHFCVQQFMQSFFASFSLLFLSIYILSSWHAILLGYGIKRKSVNETEKVIIT